MNTNVKNKKIKWIIYTVSVALIPILARLIVCLVTKQGVIEKINGGDVIAFGLVLHISNINELEHINSASEKSWKTVQNGISIIFITFYGLLFGLSVLAASPSSDINLLTTKYCAIFLSIASLAISYSVYDRISKIPEEA